MRAAAKSVVVISFLTATALGQKPELVVETGHTNWVNCVAFSPDGRTLASSSQDSSIKLWDVADRRETHTLADEGFVWSVAFSPDARILASAGSSRTIKLWDVASRRQLRTLSGHASWIITVAFSPDGRTLASGSLDKTIKLWDVASGRELRTMDGHSDQVNSVAFSPDGQILASGSNDKTIRLWDVASGRELRTISGHTDAVDSVAFSPDEHLLASGSDDKTIKLWDVASGRELRTISGHTGAVNSVAISPDGRTLASGSDDKTIRLWDVANGSELQTLNGPTDKVVSVAFSPDGQTLASGSQDHSVRLWNPASGSEIGKLVGHAHFVTSLALSPDGRTLASGSGDPIVRLWDTVDGGNPRTLSGHTDVVWSVAFSPDGHTLASGSWDKTIKLWDVASGSELRTLAGHTDKVFSVAFSPDGHILASGSIDKTIKLWDTASGRELRTLSGHTSAIRSVAFSPDGHIIASGSADKTIKIWDVASGREMLTLPGQTDAINYVSFSPDGRILASGSWDGTIKLWDATSGSELRTLSGPINLLRSAPSAPEGAIRSLAFSPDGRTLASASNTTVKLWNVASGSELRGLTGHTDYVFTVAFSPDGHKLISGGGDGSLRVWDAVSGNQLAAVYALDATDWAAIDPQGRFDASPGGMALMHYIVEEQCDGSALFPERVSLDQLKDRYYEPGLMAKAFGFNKEPLRNVSNFDHVSMYPQIRRLGNVGPSGKLSLELMNCGGGFGQVQVFVNDKQFIADARRPQSDPKAQETTLEVDLKGAPVIPGQRNEVRVVAWNAEGYVHSRGEIVDYIPSAGTSAKGLIPIEASEPEPGKYKADLYAIVAGVSSYSERKLNLGFPSKDAESMARALQLAGDRLFGCGHVHIFLFSSSEKAPAVEPCMTGSSAASDEVTWAAPAKANLQNAFTAAGKARPQDVLVVYLSGHGVAFGDKYVYPTADANTIDPEALSRDSELLSQTAITSDELADWVNKGIPATHEVMILDTCAAGAAAVKMAQMREVPGDQTRALDRLKDNTGFHMLMGSAADAVSYEASSYGQGLLTYALLEGMKGAALKNDVDVDVVKLFQYAADRVPGLAHGIGGIQKPLQLGRLGATSFAIGEIESADKSRIPLAAPMPVILAPRLIDPDPAVLSDNLSLERAVSAKLRDATDANSRGSAATLAIFVPADDLQGAIRPSGTYTVSHAQVTVKLGLIRDGKLIASRNVLGAANDIPALAAKIVTVILEVTKTMQPNISANISTSPSPH